MLKFMQKKLATLLLVALMIMSMGISAFAGSNPLYFTGSYLATINGQTSTEGMSIVDSSNVTSGTQHILVHFDKNVVSDAVFNGESVLAHNQGAIHLRDVTTSTDISISPYRLGDGSGTSPEKQHIFFDANLVSGHDYQITLDADLIANNGLTLGSVNYINFTAQ